MCLKCVFHLINNKVNQQSKWSLLEHGEFVQELTGTIGPFFFENDYGPSETVNGERYLAILTDWFFTEIILETLTFFSFNRTVPYSTCHNRWALNGVNARNTWKPQSRNSFYDYWDKSRNNWNFTQNMDWSNGL